MCTPYPALVYLWWCEYEPYPSNPRVYYVRRNPPEEQGFREEWKKQTGWHRKEDIYLRGGNKQPISEQPKGDINNGDRVSVTQNQDRVADKDKHIQGRQKGHVKEGTVAKNGVVGRIRNHTVGQRSEMWVMILLMILCALFANFHSRRRICRGRKKVEDIV